jgi:hypothetical protein
VELVSRDLRSHDLIIKSFTEYLKIPEQGRDEADASI